MAKRKSAGRSVEEPAADRRIDVRQLQREQQDGERRCRAEMPQQEIRANRLLPTPRSGA
jgi:hypothetical protein